MKSSRRKAFTLIELLVTSVILVSVALFATTSLISTVQLQVANKQSQDLTATLQRVLSEISHEVEVSEKGIDFNGVIGNTSRYSLRTVNLTDTRTNFPNYPNDDLLVLTVPVATGGGGVGTTLEKHVYCAEQLTLSNGEFGKRLVRYTIDPNADFSTQYWVTPNQICTPTAIKTLFQLGGAPISQINATHYLTDPNLRIVNLRFWPVWLAVVPLAGAQQYNLDPPAVRIEITARYDPVNANPEVGRRASDSQRFSDQIVTRILASRYGLYGFKE